MKQNFEIFTYVIKITVTHQLLVFVLIQKILRNEMHMYLNIICRLHSYIKTSQNKKINNRLSKEITSSPCLYYLLMKAHENIGSLRVIYYQLLLKFLSVKKDKSGNLYEINNAGTDIFFNYVNKTQQIYLKCIFINEVVKNNQFKKIQKHHSPIL